MKVDHSEASFVVDARAVLIGIRTLFEPKERQLGKIVSLLSPHDSKQKGANVISAELWCAQHGRSYGLWLYMEIGYNAYPRLEARFTLEERVEARFGATLRQDKRCIDVSTAGKRRRMRIMQPAHSDAPLRYCHVSRRPSPKLQTLEPQANAARQAPRALYHDGEPISFCAQDEVGDVGAPFATLSRAGESLVVTPDNAVSFSFMLLDTGAVSLRIGDLCTVELGEDATRLSFLDPTGEWISFDMSGQGAILNIYDSKLRLLKQLRHHGS